MALMILAMFGYPTFSATDAVTQYYCLVPLVAVQLLYFTEVKPEIAADAVDAPHVNGDAVPVKEVTEVADPVAKETVLKEAEDLWDKTHGPKMAKRADIYVKLMRKVVSTGASFISKEFQRVTKLIGGKISSEKKEELEEKLNILKSFSVIVRDEL